MRNKLSQSTDKSNPELTQNLDLIEKSIKIIIITVHSMFKILAEAWKIVKCSKSIFSNENNECDTAYTGWN